MGILDAPTPKPPRLYFSAADRTDGTLPATGMLDSQHPYVVTDSGTVSGNGFDIVSEALQTDEALAYLNFGPLNGPVREFWFEIEWSDDSESEDEVGVLIVADGPFANNYPGGGVDGNYANAGAHVLLFRDHYSYQKRDFNGPPVSKVQHYYSAPLAYGVKHRIGLLWDGETPTMVDPDGTRTAMPADTDYALWWGRYGCMQLLGQASGENKVRCHAISASPEVSLNDGLWAKAGIADPDFTATAAGVTTLTADLSRVQVFTGTTTQTVLLPTTLVSAGDEWTIVNNSTSIVTVQSSSGATLVALRDSRSATFKAMIDTPTSAGNWNNLGLTITSANGPITVPLRDNNSNLFANNFIPAKTSTATSAGTLTLGINYPQIQELTGSTTHTVLLPTTGVVAGQTWTIENKSSGVVTVQSSGANTILALRGNRTAVFMATVDTPTAAGHWDLVSLTATTANGPITIPVRDNNSSIIAHNFIADRTITASAAGTLTLGINYPQVQIITGATTHTVRLPTTSVTAGMVWTVINQSSGVVTVESSGANSVTTVAAGAALTFQALADTPTTAAHWRYY